MKIHMWLETGSITPQGIILDWEEYWITDNMSDEEIEKKLDELAQDELADVSIAYNYVRWDDEILLPQK